MVGLASYSSIDWVDSAAITVVAAALKPRSTEAKMLLGPVQWSPLGQLD